MTTPAIKRDHALALAEAGHWLFPCEHDGKRPAMKGWQKQATQLSGLSPEIIGDLPDPAQRVLAGAIAHCPPPCLSRALTPPRVRSDKAGRARGSTSEDVVGVALARIIRA
jgi:hypothetical protein